MKQGTSTSEGRSRNMRAIRAKDTKPEIVVRKALHAAGLRFRLHRKDLPGKPDIVFASRRLVVEVRGCFWHMHGCSLSNIPASRVDYWGPKLARNVSRDAANKAELKTLGWKVIEIWECEVKRPEKLRRLVELVKAEEALESKLRKK